VLAFGPSLSLENVPNKGAVLKRPNVRFGGITIVLLVELMTSSIDAKPMD
jgi:hypothetical protein